MTIKNNKKAKVLCVEDNRINQMILLKALDGLNLTIIMANNGKEALSLLIENNEDSKPFELIIMDCNMPEIDGFEATEQIRNNIQYAKFKSIPIIAMTGDESIENKNRCLSAGMNDFLNKPIDRKLLHKCVCGWLNYSLGNEVTHAVTPITNKSEASSSYEVAELIWKKESFLKRVNNNQVLAEQIVQIFLNEMPSVCESLLRAIAEENTEQIHALAHKLKGSVNNLSGIQLGSLLKETENLAKQNRTTELNELSGQLSSEFMLFIKHLNAYL